MDTAEFDLGYPALIRYVATMLFYLIIFNLLRTREQFRTALVLFVAVSVLTFLFAIVQRYLPGFSFGERSGWGAVSTTTGTGGAAGAGGGSATYSNSTTSAAGTSVTPAAVKSFSRSPMRS